MGERIMIVKKDADRLQIKVRRRMRNAFSPNEYSKIVNINDPNDIALLFEDLDVILGVPIDKAFRRYKEKKDKGFPF